MTFSDRLEIMLKQNGLNKAALSKMIGVSQPSITGWKTEGSMPKADTACKIARILNTSVEYLITGQQQGKVKKELADNSKTFIIPIIDQELSAGHGQPLPDEDTIKGYIEVPQAIKKYGTNLSAIFVNGDSMEPTISNGDLVVCDSFGYDNGEGIYAIRMNGSGFVKRIQVHGKKIIIKSDNPKYSPIEEPINSEAIQIIGRVRYMIHRIN